MQQQSFNNHVGKESVRFSETSMSPRFYGQGAPPYYGRPEEVSRDLLTNLQKGMNELKAQQVQRAKENRDPQGILQNSSKFDGNTNTYMGLNLDALPAYLS